MVKAKVAVGLAIPPKPPVGGINQVIWASRALRFDCLMVWDHLQDIFPKALWEPSFSWTATQNKSPHEFFEQQTVLGYIAGRAGRVRVGVAVTDPIRRHPVIVAQSMVTLAHLSKKAPILGIGAGERENIEPYGLSFSNPVARVEEALQVIRLCLDGDGLLNYSGKHFTLDNAVFDLKPPKGRKPQIWIGALGPRMLDLTGKYGDGWYPLGLLTAEEYGERLRGICETARAAGRNPDQIMPSLQPYMIVAPTRDEAEKMTKVRTMRFFGLLAPAESWTRLGFSHPFGDSFRGILDFMPEQYSKAELEDAIAVVPDEIASAGLLVGTPSDIAAQLRPFVAAGMRHVVPQAMSAALTRKDALYSLRALRAIRSELNG